MTDKTARPASLKTEMIDALLDEAARTPVAPMDVALMARLVADADRLLPAPEDRIAGGSVAVRGWRGVVAVMGGWPALGGMMAAGMVGLWIGTAPPQVVDDAVSSLFGATVAIDLTGLGDVFGLEG